MKKLTVILLAFALMLSLVACGGAPAPAPAPAPASVAVVPASSAAPTAEFSPEQQALAQTFLDTATRYDEVVDKVNADPNLAELQEIVDAMNEVSTAMIEADEVFADPATLTTEVMASMEIALAQTGLFLDEVEAMLANYGGKKIVTVPIEIVNNTEADLYALAMSPSNDTNWGANLLDEPLLAGESGTCQMTFTEDTLVWDLIAADSEETTLSFMGLDFSEISTDGAKLTLTATEGGEYMAMFA